MTCRSEGGVSHEAGRVALSASGSWQSDSGAAPGEGLDGQRTRADDAGMRWDDNEQQSAAAAAAAVAADRAQQESISGDNALHTWSFSDVLPRQDSFEKKWGRWADDMIDACLADIAESDCGSDSDSEFGGAAAYVQSAAASPEQLASGGSPFCDTTEPAAAAVASPDSSRGSSSASSSDVRALSDESDAADGKVRPAAWRLPQGWKLAERGSEEERSRLVTSGQTAGGGLSPHQDNPAVHSPSWLRVLGATPEQQSRRTQDSIQRLAAAPGVLTVLAVAIAVAWWLPAASPVELLVAVYRQARLCAWLPVQLAGIVLAVAALPVTRGLLREAAAMAVAR